MFGTMWSYSRSGNGYYGRSDNYPENVTYPGRGMYPGGGMYTGGVSPSYNKTDFESNGEMIYYTGFNESGGRIEAEYGPHWCMFTEGAVLTATGLMGEEAIR